MSLILPRFTMGNFTIAINMVLLAMECILLHGKPGSVMGRQAGKALTLPELIIQFLLSFAMGFGIDFSLFLLQPLEPVLYWQRILVLLAGCCIMALGIYIQLLANVAMAAGDAFTRALAAVTGKPFNMIRVISDSTLVAIAAALCLIFLHNLAGAREGTIICALLVGNIVKGYQILFGKLKAVKRLENR